jgi:uncharacterized protein YcbK (DUF882 family)
MNMQENKNETLGTDYGGYDPNEQIGKYFKLKEFLTTSHPEVANVPTPDAYENLKQLAAVLDIFRSKFGSIKITSGYRSPEYQAYLKNYGTSMEQKEAASYSLHQEGMAADITPLSTSGVKLFAAVANDPKLSELVGEFAIKENTIHMSIPTSTKQSVFMYVNQAGQYIRFKADDLTKFIKDNLGATIGIGAGILVALGGLVGFIIYKRKKAGK